MRAGPGKERTRDREGERMREREKKKKKEREKRKKGEKERRKGVEGHVRENKKEGEGGCKVQGGRRKRARVGIRVLEARWAWARFWATLSQFLKTFNFLLQK